MNKFIRTINQQLCQLLTIALMLTGLPSELFAAQKTVNKTKTINSSKTKTVYKPAAPSKNLPIPAAKTSTIPVDTKKLTSLNLSSLETASTPTSATPNAQTCATTALAMSSCTTSCSEQGTCTGSVACCTSFCSCIYPVAAGNQTSCISDCEQYYGNPADYINWRAGIIEGSWKNSVAQQICNLNQNFQSLLAKIQNYFTALGWAQTTLMNMNMQTYGTEALQPLPNTATSLNNYYVTAAMPAYNTPATSGSTKCFSNTACLDPNITAQQKCLDLTVLGTENSCFNGNCNYSGGACTNDLQCPKKVCAIPNSQACRTDSDCQAGLQDLFCNLSADVQSIDPTTNAAVSSPLNICMSRVGTVCDASSQKSNSCVQSTADSQTYTCSIDGLDCTTTKKCSAYTHNYCLTNSKCALTGVTCAAATETTDCPNSCTLNDGITPNLDLQCSCLNPNSDGSCSASSPGVCTLVNTGVVCVPGTGAVGTNADYTKCGYTGGLSCQIAPDEAASKADAGMTVCLLSLNTDATQGPLTPAITANYNSTTASNTNGCIAQTNIKGNNLCSVYGLTVAGTTASNITAQHTLSSQAWFNENNLAIAMSNGSLGSLMYDPSRTPAFNIAYNMLQVQASIYSGPLSPYSPIDPHGTAATGDLEYNLVCGRATMSDDGAFNKITVACTAAENANTAAGFDLLLNEIATAANYLNPAIYGSNTFTLSSGTCALDPSNASAGQNNTNCPFAYPNVSATVPTTCGSTGSTDSCTLGTAFDSCTINNTCGASGATCAYITCAGANTDGSCTLNPNSGTGLCNISGVASTTPCCQASDCTASLSCPNSIGSCDLNTKTDTSFCTLGTIASTIPCCQISDCNCDSPNFITAGTCNYMGNPCMTNSQGCVGADANCSLMQPGQNNAIQFAPQKNGYCVYPNGTKSAATNTPIACCTAADCTCNYSYCTNSLTSNSLIPSTSASAGTGANFSLCLPSGTCSGYTTGCDIATVTNMGFCINNSNPQNLIKSAINCCSDADCTCQPITNQLSGTGSTNTADAGYDNCASPYAGIFGNGADTMAYINCLLPASSNLGISPENPWGGPCTADDCTTQYPIVPSGINPQSGLTMSCCGDCSVACSTIANGDSVLTTQGSCVGQSCAIPPGFNYDPVLNPNGIQDQNTLCCNGTYCCTDQIACTNGTYNTCVYATISTACPSKNSDPTDCIITIYDANPGGTTTCPDPSLNIPDPKIHPANYCPNQTGQCIDNTGSPITGSSCCDCYSVACTDDTDCFVNYNSAQYSCADTYCYNPNKSTCGGICQPKHGPTIANTTPMSGATYDPTFNSICAQVGYAQNTLLTNYYNQDLTVASYYAAEINNLYQTLDGIAQITGNGHGTTYGAGATPALNTQCYNPSTQASGFCEPLSGYAALTANPNQYAQIVKGTQIMDMQAYVNALQAAIIDTLNNTTSVIDGSITGNLTAKPAVVATDTVNGNIYQAIIKATGATCTGATCTNGICTSGTPGVCTFSDGTKQPDSTLAASSQAGSSVTCSASLDCINNPISALISTGWGGKNSTLTYLPFTTTESIDPNFTGTVTPAVYYLDFAATDTTFNYSSIVQLGALTVPTDISPANVFLPSNNNSCDNSNCGNSNSPAVDCNCTIFSELLAPYGALGQSLDSNDPSFAGNTPSLTALAATHATLVNTINKLPAYNKVANWDSNAAAIYNAYNQVMADYQIVNYVYNALTTSGGYTTQLTMGSSSCPQLNTPQSPQPITQYQINQEAAQSKAALYGLLESGGMFLIGGPIITKLGEVAISKLWNKWKARKGAKPTGESGAKDAAPSTPTKPAIPKAVMDKVMARIADGTGTPSDMILIKKAVPQIAENVGHAGAEIPDPKFNPEMQLEIQAKLLSFDVEINTTFASSLLRRASLNKILSSVEDTLNIPENQITAYETEVRARLEAKGDGVVDINDFRPIDV